MATAREVIVGSLRLLGVKGSGDTLDSTEDSELIVLFNDLLEGWSNEGLMTHQRTRETATWTGGQASRTWGTAGTLLTTARPLKIESAFARSGNTDYPLTIITDEEYNQITDKTQQATIPEKLYLQPSMSTATLHLWPVPSASVTVGFSTLKAFSSIAIGDTLAFPPGYNKAIRFNLAIELAPEYGKSVTEEIVMTAREAKDVIKRINLVIPKVGFEPITPGLDAFDINTGEAW